MGPDGFGTSYQVGIYQVARRLRKGANERVDPTTRTPKVLPICMLEISENRSFIQYMYIYTCIYIYTKEPREGALGH